MHLALNGLLERKWSISILVGLGKATNPRLQTPSGRLVLRARKPWALD